MKKILFKIIILIICICGIFLVNKCRAAESISVVKPGDYIDYSAGTWTQEEINKLKERELYSEIPMSEEGQASFQFNCFFTGTSRDKSVAIVEDFPEGWRILSNNQGVIKIISSGVTEGYMSAFGDEYAYLTYYILNGEKHPDDNSDIVEKQEIDVKRDWSMYENLNFAIKGSAHCITGQEAFDITGDYAATSNNLRNINNHYMTSSLHCNQDMWTVEASGKMDRWGGYYGIRPVVILKNDLQVEENGSYKGNTIWKIVKSRRHR